MCVIFRKNIHFNENMLKALLKKKNEPILPGVHFANFNIYNIYFVTKSNVFLWTRGLEIFLITVSHTKQLKPN